jgi:hypothetical protein
MSAAVILQHDPVKGFKVLPRIITSWGFSSYTSMEIPLLVLKIPNHDLLASSHRIFFLFLFLLYSNDTQLRYISTLHGVTYCYVIALLASCMAH